MDDDAHSANDGSVDEDSPVQTVAITQSARNKNSFAEWARNHRQDAYRSLRDSIADKEVSFDGAETTGAKPQAIINSPREYQTELVDKAKEKNIIVVLDTGAGKTLIAVLLLRHIVEQELEDRKNGHDHRLAFFLVDKVALVHQQYRVLETNLDFSMALLTGQISGVDYSLEFWNQLREKKTVVVCTADVLYGNLLRAFIRMDQINLLIFDEAHHTKKNHSYARIIREYYAGVEENGGKRPRILGMTASPVDAKTDVDTAAAKLEGLLHSEIATAVTSTELSNSLPTQAIIHYQNLGTPFKTELWQELYQIVGKSVEFAKMFAYSEASSCELGRWAADRVWKIWLTKEEADKIEARTERAFTKMTWMQPDALVKAEREAIGAIRQAYQLISEHHASQPEAGYLHLSHKVIRLIQLLKENFNPVTDRYVIFAEQRLTVVLLADLLSQPHLGLLGYRTGVLIGSSGNSSGDMSTTIIEQQAIINKFRRGEINCLFATSAGEEGIDIPDCNAVIRFDLYKTMIQYIQSRGRARKPGSKFFVMVDSGNITHKELIDDIRDHEKKLREFCSTLPEDRFVAGRDYDIEYHLSKEKTHPIYKVPSTGATLTYQSSLSVLALFVTSLPRPAEAPIYAADYIIHGASGKFICQVVLPESSPVRGAVGEPASSKHVAKCSAAFTTCLKLRQQKHLNENLQPTFTKRLPAMRNARLAISSKKRSEYPMKLKPDVWSRLGAPEVLYMTVIKLSSPESMGRPSRPLGLLTREPLSQIGEFPIYLGYRKESDVRFLHLSTAMTCCKKDIDGLNQFTLRIFKDVFSKEYASDIDKMPYFFAPLLHSHDYFRDDMKDDSLRLTLGRDPHAVIDWDCVRGIQNGPDYIEWENQPEEVFDDRFVVDPFDGSRKFYTVRRRPDLKATDPQLPGLPLPRGKKAQEDAPNDIWNYTISLWGKSRSNLTRRENLSVVEANYIPLHRNVLVKSSALDNDGYLSCYLVFQMLKLSALPVDIVAMAYNMPAVIYRLESNLIAIEACKSMGFDLQPGLALEAMTKNGDDDEEYQTQRSTVQQETVENNGSSERLGGSSLNRSPMANDGGNAGISQDEGILQEGMGKDYERLEFLGDSFLKMATTIALFSQIQDGDEFQYHVHRMILVCNKNLFNNALELKLEESVRTQAFDRRNWYPEGLTLLKGKRGNIKPSHAVPDKAIADVCEAIIGAAYLTTYKENNFDMAIQAVTKFVNNDHHRMTSYGDYFASYEIPDWQKDIARAVHNELADAIEKKMGYKFKYPRLLRSAFCHPSYGSVFEGIPSYQRLEFLGDALLDMVCVDFLFHTNPEADPQWLTEHKMAMVSNQFLGCLCVSLNLHQHIVLMDGHLPGEIAEYVQNMHNAKAEAEEAAVKSGLPPEAYARNYWTKEKRPPKCVPDIVEAYVGAVFVDSGYDYGQVQHFFKTFILPYFENIRLYDEYANNHPVTLLTKLLDTKFRCRSWRLCSMEADDENRGFTDRRTINALMIHGDTKEYTYADSTRNAKSRIAQRFMNRVKDMDVVAFRREFGCDCPYEEPAVKHEALEKLSLQEESVKNT